MAFIVGDDWRWLIGCDANKTKQGGVYNEFVRLLVLAIAYQLVNGVFLSQQTNIS